MCVRGQKEKRISKKKVKIKTSRSNSLSGHANKEFSDLSCIPYSQNTSHFHTIGVSSRPRNYSRRAAIKIYPIPYLFLG